MSRRKNLDRAAAQQELERRRNSAAHRSLRKRAEKGKGARAAASAPVSTPAEQPEVSERTPTSELAAPSWLASEPEVAPTPEQPQDDSDEALAGGAVAAEGTESDADASDSEAADDDADSDDADGDSRTTERASFVAAAAAAKFASSRASAPSAEVEVDDSETDVKETEESADAASDAEATAVMDPVSSPEPESAPPAEPQFDPQPYSVAPATTEPEDGEPQKKGGKGWLVLVAVLVVLAGLYAGAAALLSNTVPRGTTAMGVEIGGMSTGQAVAALDDEVEVLAEQDITVTVSDESGTVNGAESGLGVDTQATVEQVIGFTLEPLVMWHRIAGGGELDVIKTVDSDQLMASMRGLSRDVNREPTDASVEIVGTAAVASEGQTGVDLDEDATGALVTQAWPTSFEVEGVAEVIEPTISTGTAKAFADEVTQVAFAGPVTLVSDNGEVLVDAEDVASHASVVTHGGTLALEVDGEPLAEALRTEYPELVTEPKDAELSFTDDHDIDITEGVTGQDVDGEALGEAIVEASYAATRAADLPVQETEPEVSNESLGVEDLKEVVASFDTPLTNEYIRTQNLITAAADVEGTVILPGEQFNLAETLAPITPEEGYGEAHVIVDGVLTNGVGGGLSQMATTTYNVGYFAGMELIQHRPHSVWFTRYPAGRESTLWGTTINVIFENNTPYAAVLNSYVDGGRLYVDMWSTPHFDVETYASDKTNVRSPGVMEVDDPNCEAKGPGQDGFTITNTRKVFLEGEQVDENVDTWTYEPDDAIRCVSPEDEDEDDDN